ncbi:exopolysaccharide biosynthesis protein [Arthrobacter livingstonensis]|uniref:Exopolysaccharide biosynthesis protein n=1 Tax=Arthrobacter livingstonensis TaxID=670078 RepID=A0A2V5M068_9MICC|nr:WecB/TagA/CpsF family glycosyltransferase [Arthrobacter livingstonensis]PYI68356.1 exopolysaccharide biosynthesis protein [Arthrobacter livingstonensis]
MSGRQESGNTALLTERGNAVTGSPYSRPARAILGGTNVDLRGFDDAVAEIISAARRRHGNPLAVVSANLDHVLHFGTGGRWGGTLEKASALDWLTLLDGAPLRAKATALTGQSWPRLAGSDLIHPLLDEAEANGLRVAFLGGSAHTHQLLKKQLQDTRPALRVSGWWAPNRAELTAPEFSERLAGEVAQSGTDMLVVGLGKPLQELWIGQYGALTGAPVMLAFGAVVDFLAGRIKRAPQSVANAGMEWAWRLALEPRRLANRYLVQGPEAYMRMNRHSSLYESKATPAQGLPAPVVAAAGQTVPARENRAVRQPGTFVALADLADVTAVLVTYNNAGDIDPLLQCLRGEAATQSLKVVIADNGSTDGTLERVGAHADVVLVKTGGNLGYAGGINAALRNAGAHGDVLVLNPDLRIVPGAIAALRRRLAESGVGIVVPKLLDDDGTTYPSLRREPGTLKSMGDALMGQRLPGRPDWLSEIDYNTESYHFPHTLDWATGAALLISANAVADVGDWDERYFLYSEETDYCRRVRQTGRTIWFEPAAVMSHSRGGSGASADLVALMAVNRVRYAQAHHSKAYARAVRTIAAAGELARIYKPGNRKAFLALTGLLPWSRLPRAVSAPVPAQGHPSVQAADFPPGAVIIPAHNEAAVIARTLQPLAALAESGAIEVIVACNGCSDDTAAIAARFPGVSVLDLPEPSKTGALNAADAMCSRWPRLYLDADIEMTAGALATVFEHLAGPGALAARPAFRYDTSGADPIVRAYYRTRLRIPDMSEHLWGAGAYGVSAEGHRRFGQFPAATGDDAYVDSLFGPHEKAILATTPVVVRTPKSAQELLKTLQRVYRGNRDLQLGQSRGSALGTLARTATGPQALVDAGIYASIAVLGKLRNGKSLTTSGGWDRDESSRGALDRETK